MKNKLSARIAEASWYIECTKSAFRQVFIARRFPPMIMDDDPYPGYYAAPRTWATFKRIRDDMLDWQ
jgi:hypothetical protein